MDTRVVAVLAIVLPLAAWSVWFVGRAILLQRRLGRDRVVTCPETGCSALVRIDVALAVTSTAGSELAPLSSCSRWAERGGCNQPCLRAAHAPESDPTALVAAWADGRECATCGKGLEPTGTGTHRVALLQPDAGTREWTDVPAHQLPLALATSLPVCWNCHVASTFRRLHPELVTDRDV